MLRFKPDFRWVFFNSQNLILKCLKMQFVKMESSKWFYCQRGILKWLALSCFSFPLLSFFLENEFYSFFIENKSFLSDISFNYTFLFYLFRSKLAADSPIQRGTVTEFCRGRGHGFVKPDDEESPIFLHISE